MFHSFFNVALPLIFPLYVGCLVDSLRLRSSPALRGCVSAPLRLINSLSSGPTSASLTSASNGDVARGLSVSSSMRRARGVSS